MKSSGKIAMMLGLNNLLFRAFSLSKLAFLPDTTKNQTMSYFKIDSFNLFSSAR
jgi:hypothetical protein